MSLQRRLLVLLAVPLGMWLAVVGAFQHLRTLGPFPWAAVLAVLLVTVAVRATALLSGGRRAGALVLIGWVLVTAALVLLAPGGDIILTDTVPSYVYLLGGVVLPTAAATLPAVRLRSLAEQPVPPVEIETRL